jgi:hypothetical protein
VFGLKSENVRKWAICILEGEDIKAAVRRTPDMMDRLRGILEMRLSHTAPGTWLALKASGVTPFEWYTLRHTCLTRWGEYMDPWRCTNTRDTRTGRPRRGTFTRETR